MLCSIAGASLLSVTNAQTPRAASGPAEVTLEKFVVTGSNIPTAADAIAVPVTILGPREIERSGINTNLLELIRKELPYFAGSGNLGNSNANTGANSTLGGSQVSLRNLDTLVLVNGRRVANNGANGRGGRSFVDVNQFPISAVESIEVLTDGASAIYGSDAVGGVVNIKLKSNFTGVETGARYAMGKSDYSEQSAYMTMGVSRGPIRATVSVSYAKTDPLLQKDRPFSAQIFGRTSTLSGAVFPSPAIPNPTAGGAALTSLFLNPAINSPKERNPTGTAATAADLSALLANGTYVARTTTEIANTFDIAPHATLLVKQDQRAASGSISMDVMEQGKVQIFGDFIYSTIKGFSQLAAQPTTPNLTIPANSPFNPTRTTIAGVAFRYLPKPRKFFNDSELKHLMGGVRGKISDRVNWEVAYNLNDNRTLVRTQNVLYLPNINRALAGGFNAQGVATPGGAFSRVITNFSESSGTFVIQPALDGMARPAGIDPASLENIFGTSLTDVASKLNGLDAQVTATVFTLPAGDVGLAVGTGILKEVLSGMPDENSRITGPTAQRWLGATFFDPLSRSRDIKSSYAEVRIPITSPRNNIPGFSAVDLTAAYRIEDYSDAGKSKVPKYGLRWQPMGDQVTLRYTYSEAFSAPTLYSLFGPTTQGFVAAGVMSTVFGQNFNQAQSRTGSNPNLRPSTAKTHSYGVVLSPKAIKGLTVSASLIKVDQVDVVSSAGVITILQSAEQLGAASPYASQVTFENFPGEAGAVAVTRAGQLGEFLRAGNQGNRIYIFDGRVNLAGQRVKAFDLTVDYALPTTEAGKFEFSTTGTFFLDYLAQALPTERYYEYAGHATNSGSISQGTIPGYRFYTAITWAKGPWNALLGNTYIPPVVDIGGGGITYATSANKAALTVPVRSYTTWDAQVGYTFRGARAGSGWRSWMNGLRVSAGVNNITDQFGGPSPAFNEAGVDIATYSPVGRLFFLSGSVKF